MTSVKFCEPEGKYAAFSNYFIAAIEVDGKRWPTTEHFFQAQKFTSEDYQEQIRNASSPSKSKELGYARRPDFRKDWEQVKDGLMKKCQLAKFSQHQDLLKILLETGDAEIIEDNEHDPYWGNGPDGSGKNMLGKILMEVRGELKNKI